jgi:hypothetical protein
MTDEEDDNDDALEKVEGDIGTAGRASLTGGLIAWDLAVALESERGGRPLRPATLKIHSMLCSIQRLHLVDCSATIQRIFFW